MQLTQPVPPAGTVRPGGRTARTRRAVLLATQDELLRHGYAAFSVPRVAARAGVHKTTIYRRWQRREGLISDLITVMGETTVPIPHTGQLAQDLNAFAHEITRALSGKSGLTVRALLAAAASDPHLQDQITAFYRRRYGAAEQMITRAVDRGELDRSVDPTLVIRALAGPLYYTLLVYGRAPTTTETRHAITAALAYAVSSSGRS
ncbi:TetR/AcrR family transcriptional regulator [Ornithinimicrobium panacihumi]|uniref:TetR/AcrR family transcriptional regulator n=1 Tax=Ornithinimicrobium panacihumi TaxID=2008449 RepID=UPI003F88D15F